MAKFAFKNETSTAEALATLLYPYAEILIHDLETQKIRVIFNSFSKRKEGDDSLLDAECKFDNEPDVLGPYSKVNWDGKHLKSITSVIRDEKGKARGLLCINIDLSVFDQFHNSLSAFLGKDKLHQQPTALFKDDWREKINSFVNAYVVQNKKTLSALTNEERHSIITLLEKEGAFSGKNAASYISDILGISRASVYNYLKMRKK